MRKAASCSPVRSQIRQGVLSLSMWTRWKTRNGLLAKTPIPLTVYLNGSTFIHLFKCFRKSGSQRPVAPLLQPLLPLPSSGHIAPSATTRYSYLNGSILAIVLSCPSRARSMGTPCIQRPHENRYRRWPICHGRWRHLSRRRSKSPPTSPTERGGRSGHLSRNYIPRCGKRIWREKHTNQFAGNQNDCRRYHRNGNPRIQALLRAGSSRLLRTHSCHGQCERPGG